MDSEELVSRYKMLPIAARLLVALLVGLLPAYYIYFEEGDALESEMANARDRLNIIEAKFERERVKRNKLPELEAKLAFTEQQLRESSKLLPDVFQMQDVLQEASIIAREVGVDVQVFDPGQAVAGGSAFKYMELPIEVVVVGRYHQIAAFYDRLANLEKMIHVRDFKLQPWEPPGKAAPKLTASASAESDLLAAQKNARSDFRVEAAASVVIYRAIRMKEGANGKLEGEKSPDNAPDSGQSGQGPGQDIQSAPIPQGDDIGSLGNQKGLGVAQGLPASGSQVIR